MRRGFVTTDSVDGGRRRWVWWAVAAVMVLAAVIVGMVVVLDGSSGSGEGSVRVTEPVGLGTIEEVVVTRGVIGHAPMAGLEAAGQGRMTSLDVEVGDVIEPGALLWELDGRPSVAAAGTTPFWRELSSGSLGPDVSLLQQMLSRQGAEVDDSGEFDEATGRALRQWQRDHGYADPDGVLQLSDVVVTELPARVGNLAVEVGTFVQQSTVVVETTAIDTSVTIELNPSDRARAEEGDPVRVLLSATGEGADGQLAAASVEPETREDGSTYFTGNVSLDGEVFDEVDGAQAQVTIVVDRAVDVMTVPVAAVAATSDGSSGVRVVTGPDTSMVVSVELGLTQGDRVEVVAGLDGSEEVVVAEAGSGGDTPSGP